MKKIIVICALAITFFSINVNAVTNQEIATRTKLIIEQNLDIDNPDLIKPGEYIWIDSVGNHFVMEGESIWRIARQQLLREEIIKSGIHPVVTIKKKSNLIWWLLALVGSVLILIWLRWELKRKKKISIKAKENHTYKQEEIDEAKKHASFDKKKATFSRFNSDNFFPAIDGGFRNKNTKQIVDEIEKSYNSKSTVMKIKRMQLSRNDEKAVKRIPVSMAHRGNRTKSTNAAITISWKILFLNPSDFIWVVWRKNGDVDHFVEHCGNHFAEISNGKFNLPDGWSAVVLAKAKENAFARNRSELRSQKRQVNENLSWYEEYTNQINFENQLELYSTKKIS